MLLIGAIDVLLAQSDAFLLNKFSLGKMLHLNQIRKSLALFK
jgi:hypothetical protein